MHREIRVVGGQRNHEASVLCDLAVVLESNAMREVIPGHLFFYSEEKITLLQDVELRR